MTEQNKKNSRLQLNEGTIYVDAESIVFKPQAFEEGRLENGTHVN